jgi:hypothetical protein
MRARITCLSVLLLVASAAPSFASSPISAKVGVNLAKFSGEQTNEEALVGFVAGVAIKVAGNDTFAVVPEILFSQKGSKSKGSSDKLKMNYIDIPILVHLNIPTGASVRPFITVGPTVGFRLSAKLEPELNVPGFEPGDFFKKFDAGIAVGAGVQASELLSIEFRFQQSLASILSSDGEDLLGSSTVRNRTLSFLVGIGR